MTNQTSELNNFFLFFSFPKIQMKLNIHLDIKKYKGKEKRKLRKAERKWHMFECNKFIPNSFPILFYF